MDEPSQFLIENTVLDLSMVMDVAHPPNFDLLPSDEAWAMVKMRDGSHKVLKGRPEVETFMDAMDRYLGADLV